MKKRFIILVIITISVSLVGLLFIQLYWIRNAVSVKEVHFDRGVSEAVSRAIYKFNKQELARKLTREHERNPYIGQLTHLLDSLNRLHYNQVFYRESQRNNSGRDGSDLLWMDSRFAQKREFLDDWQAGAIDTSHNMTNFHYYRTGSGYIPQFDPAFKRDPFAAFFERSKMITDLFEDLFSSRYSFQVTDKQSLALLDSLLNYEFQIQGIQTPYEYGIYHPHQHSLLSERTGHHSRELLRSPYAFHLFPNDLFVNPEYLLLHFPQQERYILSQMNTMLGASVVLLVILVSSFGFTILTIIRQKQLSAMKSDFINNMTHELKTPISIISLACQALSDQDVKKSEPLYNNYINVINEENERLGLLTERVLQTALIEKARIRLSYVGLDLHQLLQSAIEKVGLHVEARHGKITTDFAAEYSYVKADKVHLANVFSNLIDNANKYSQNSPQIKISTENNESGVIVHVDDKGVGISRANQKKIFDNLYRVSTGNIHDVKGFGLGLSYVKHIVEKHGGNISLESEINKGSRFTVFIPFGYDGNGSGKNQPNYSSYGKTTDQHLAGRG